jgi:AcrR family transcriptional regulator
LHIDNPAIKNRYVNIVNYAITLNMSTPPRSSYHHGQLRPVLLAEARAQLDAGGPESVSLRETARRAGVSATATYRHFSDKDSLLAAVAAEGFREFGKALADSIKDGRPFAAMGRAYVEFALAHPGLFRLMFSPLIRERDRFPDLKEASEQAFRGLQMGAAAARNSPDANADAAALAAWSLVHGLSHLLLDGAIPSPFAGSAIDLVLGAPKGK